MRVMHTTPCIDACYPVEPQYFNIAKVSVSDSYQTRDMCPILPNTSRRSIKQLNFNFLTKKLSNTFGIHVRYGGGRELIHAGYRGTVKIHHTQFFFVKKCGWA